MALENENRLLRNQTEKLQLDLRKSVTKLIGNVNF